MMNKLPQVTPWSIAAIIGIILLYRKFMGGFQTLPPESLSDVPQLEPKHGENKAWLNAVLHPEYSLIPSGWRPIAYVIGMIESSGGNNFRHPGTEKGPFGITISKAREAAEFVNSPTLFDEWNGFQPDDSRGPNRKTQPPTPTFEQLRNAGLVFTAVLELKNRRRSLRGWPNVSSSLTQLVAWKFGESARIDVSGNSGMRQYYDLLRRYAAQLDSYGLSIGIPE